MTNPTFEEIAGAVARGWCSPENARGSSMTTEHKPGSVTSKPTERLLTKSGKPRRLAVTMTAELIAEGVIAWADEDREGRASRYPIPPWPTYEAIAERVVLELGRHRGL
jgi:hypothetical protein